MSRIEELVARLSPNGVEVKALGEVGEFIRGNGLQKKDFAAEGVGCIHYGQIHTHYGVWAADTISFVSPDLAARLRRARPGDLVIATTSEDDAAVGKAVAWLGVDEVAVSSDAYIFRHSLDPKFVSYFFQSEHFQAQKALHITGTKVRRLSGASLSKLRVPVPPLDVQRAIVKVLDDFTELEAELAAELAAELEARRMQYSHYRDALLGAASLPGTPWMALGKIGEFVRGRRFTKDDFAREGIDCIHYGEIYTHYGVSAQSVVSHLRPDIAVALRYASPGDVIIVDVGETVEDVGKAVAWLGSGPVAIHDHCYAFRHGLNPAFISYCMQTSAFRTEKAKFIARTKVNTLLIEGFRNVRIPTPPIEEQDRIVAILDQLDTLVTDLSIGLPAELKARRQQYEHYRDRLLTFKESA